MNYNNIHIARRSKTLHVSLWKSFRKLRRHHPTNFASHVKFERKTLFTEVLHIHAYLRCSCYIDNEWWTIRKVQKMIWVPSFARRRSVTKVPLPASHRTHRLLKISLTTDSFMFHALMLHSLLKPLNNSICWWSYRVKFKMFEIDNEKSLPEVTTWLISTLNFNDIYPSRLKMTTPANVLLNTSMNPRNIASL